MTRTCPGCNLEYDAGSWHGVGTLPDRSSTSICRKCREDGVFQGRLNALTWDQGKALKRDLKARGYLINRSDTFNELKDGILGLVFGSLIAVGGIALAVGSRGMVIAWGAVLVCTGWAIKSLFATGKAGYQMWNFRRMWRRFKG